MGPPEIARALAEAGVVPDRRLGQSFLADSSIAGRIAAEAFGSVLEVGPGLGALTTALARAASGVTALEVSGRLVEWLSGRMREDSVRIVRGDFLRTDPAGLPGHPFDCLASNLPYSISSHALARLTEPGFSAVRRAVVMLQSEVAARVCARPGDRAWGRLALCVWPQFTVRRLLEAGPEAFYPRPAVSSAVLVLERRPEPVIDPDLERRFRRIVAVCFARRRKTVLNNLASVLGRAEAASALGAAGVDSGLRAEQIGPEEFVRLTEAAG
jgi:16S rRNA (adenine1518-N6/adenine1519-N6)-dimethyltransferase